MAYLFSPFRKEYENRTHYECDFCAEEIKILQGIKDKNGTLVENKFYYWMVSYFPKYEGHTLVVPKRHFCFISDETNEEVVARQEMICKASSVLQKLYPEAGIEVFFQTGLGSASSIKHLHWHVVPAFPDDPLRSMEKLGNFITMEENKEKVLLFPTTIRLARQDLQNELTKLI